jgi:diaminohydroxyphosphoribosylaminopyrimidine deaminase/5-amino-6-(5-phosphoribosylamino)uracil reductase
MMECLHLAQKGAGYVSPNPMVGAVLVKNGRVIGRGYHKQFGGRHAEVNAIRSAKTSVAGSTLYVNLEPCNFHGKTPPCTDLIIASRIKKVVIGTLDQNPRVRGKGVSQLRNHGIEVITGVLEDDCKKLNEKFIKYIRTQIPFITLKIAQSLDGKIADITGTSQWITNEKSRTVVHKLRSQYDAVLVGAGTVIKDNPELTVRHVKGRNPLRVIIDSHFSTNINAKVFSRKSKTIIFTSKKQFRKHRRKRNSFEKKGIEIIPMDDSKNGAYNLNRVLSILGSKGVASVLVEGGATIFSLFLEQKLTDKVLFFVAPKIYGDGLSAFRNLIPKKHGNELQLSLASVQQIGNDVLIEGYLH